MANFYDKISNLINSQVPDFVLEDHPLFLDFVKAYYKLLESAKIDLVNIGAPSHIQLHSSKSVTNYLNLDGTTPDGDDEGDKVLLEDTTFGDFQNGEVITGQTSGATTTILVEDVGGNQCIFVVANAKFIEGEIIVGATSEASATIKRYRANPVQNIQQLLDYADVDKTISGFLTKFRNAFLTSIPDTLHSEVDKRNLIKNVKSLYQAKGTKRASEIFFKLLFNENAEIRYPKDNILRVSDGKWDTKKIMRVVEVGDSQAAHLIGQTITQENDPVDTSVNEATAVVEDVFKFVIGGTEITELVLGDTSVEGTFLTGQTITGTDNTDSDITVKVTITGIIDEKTITNDGAFYNEGDDVVITAGGTGATMKLGPVGSGAIEEVIIDQGGTDYEIGDVVNFSFGNASAKVSVVNGGITVESGTANEGHIVLEDQTQESDPYHGDKLVQESGTGVGDITDVRMINKGNGFISLPVVTVTSSSGLGTKLLANGPEVGRALTLKMIETGHSFEQSPAPTLTLPTYVLVGDVSGSFPNTNTITSPITANIVSHDTATNFLKLSNASGTLSEGATITASDGATAVVKKVDQATATVTVAGVNTTDGAFENEDGWISEDTMKIQDSLLYQDYSYIIRVGRSINEWRDSYIKTLHSAGFYFQGEIVIETNLNAKLKRVTGINSGSDSILLTVIGSFYSTLIGRRLGTATDGTSLRANAKEALSADLDASTITQFDRTTRDVTLSTQEINIDYTSRPREDITDASGNVITIRRGGLMYSGPRFGTINKFANTAFGVTANNAFSSSNINFTELHGIRVKGTGTSLDGQRAIFLMTSDPVGQKLKTNFTIPAIIGEVDGDSFDENQTFFDSTTTKFDKAA